METSAGKKEFRPTEAQARAIEGALESMAVDAAAGSGKTAVLVRRILAIAESDWAKLGEILAITFTEKAAGEFRAKLRPHVPGDQRYRLQAAWIGTFHSFCARLLRRFGPAIGLDPSFELLDENAAGMEARSSVRDTLLRLLEEGDADAETLVEEAGFGDAIGALEELIAFRWHADAALEERTECDEWEAGLLGALKSVFARARGDYLARLCELAALDFQELEIRALELLENEGAAKSCRAMFRYILVDEYQDTNDIQTELVRRLYDPASNRLFIVGDEAQSIYRFRGANVACFAKVRRLIESRQGSTLRLAHNFRSRKSIISFVNSTQGMLADGLFADPASPKPMEATREDGAGTPVIELAIPPAGDTRIASLREREARAIAAMIRQRTDEEDWRLGDVVLLFRAMGAAGTYEAALRRMYIPCSSVGGRGFLERTEVADLMAALEYASSGDEVALVTLLRSPIAGLADDELAVMAGPDGRGLRRAVANDARTALVAELPAMASHMRPSEIIRRVVNEAGLELFWAGLDPSGAALANIDRLATIARDLEREVPTTLADFTAFMSEMRSRGAKLGEVPPGAGESEAVRLMTVHAAKGMEFPVVFLPDLMRKQPASRSGWIFTRGDAGAAIAFKRRDPAKPFGTRIKTYRFKRLADDEATKSLMESKRLLYVAMTRAIDALIMPTHDGIKDSGSWHQWVRLALSRRGEPSAALRVEAGDLEGPAASGARLGEVEAYAANVEHRPSPGASRLSVTQLDSYSVCPMQYYLKYVLGLPASEVTRDDPSFIEPNVTGSIVHAMLARATDDAGQLEAAARAACLANGVAVSEKRIRELVDTAAKAVELDGGDPTGGFRELPFELMVAGATISGTIDWLRPVGGGYEIVDYKTGTSEGSRASARAEHYEVQMQAYALAAEAMIADTVVATKLVFPSAGKSIVRRMDAARRDEARRNIGRIVVGISAHRYDVPKRPPCDGCVFKRNAMCWEAKYARKAGKASKASKA